MPRGFKSEERITDLLRENVFLDDRSELVRDQDGNPHLLLYGQDMSNLRQKAIWRAKQRCEWMMPGNKRCPVRDNLEMDHIVGGLTGRADELANVRILCHDHHVYRHGRG